MELCVDLMCVVIRMATPLCLELYWAENVGLNWADCSLWWSDSGRWVSCRRHISALSQEFPVVVSHN